MNPYVTLRPDPDASLRRAPRLVAAVIAILLATLALPIRASAANGKVDGVRATVVDGALRVKGASRADAVAVRLAPGDQTVVQVDTNDDGLADFSFTRSAISSIDVDMGAGDDVFSIDDVNGPFTDSVTTTIGGGPGDDALRGGLGAERFYGGSGDDTVGGGRGSDTAQLDAGDDIFTWLPGEGSDVIEGNAGSDTMAFDGANVAEAFTMTANGGRVLFARNIGTITMDTDGVETVDLKALGGADTVTINDLTGTDVTQTTVSLAGASGGGDAAADAVTVKGAGGDDSIRIDGTGSGADVTGLATAVTIDGAEADDSLSIDTLAGDDAVNRFGDTGMRVFVDGAPA